MKTHRSGQGQTLNPWLEPIIPKVRPSAFCSQLLLDTVGGWPASWFITGHWSPTTSLMFLDDPPWAASQWHLRLEKAKGINHVIPAGDDAQKGHVTQSLPCPQSPEVRNQKGAVLPWVWDALSSAGLPNLWDLRPGDLRWSWRHNIRNKVHNKCNVLEPSSNQPSHSSQWKKLSSVKLVPGAEKAEDSCSGATAGCTRRPCLGTGCQWTPFRRESVLGDIYLPSFPPLCLWNPSFCLSYKWHYNLLTDFVILAFVSSTIKWE